MYERLTRRAFVTELGRTTLGVAVLGSVIAACAAEDPTARASGSSPKPSLAPPGTGAGLGEQGDWRRVDLGFVSAYVLVRSGEAAVVDTGVGGSQGDIEAALTAAGSSWADVAHVILTHKHQDHVGSLSAVMVAATGALAYAGAEDIPAMNSPRDVRPVTDGDQVFGLDIVATPGHTPGHISVLDPAASLLVAGDAINGDGGGVVGPNPGFSQDMNAANASVVKLAELDFDTVVFGHGVPVVANASVLVGDLAGSL